MAVKKITGKFDSIEAVLRDIARGKMVVVVDDADRENEGDLSMAAEKTTAKAVNFMAKHGRGLICAPTAPERLQQLGIERMVLNNRETHRTDFQISVDAAQGITTGISAADRAKTIKILANPTSIADDLVQPGHVFPLRAPGRPAGSRGCDPGRSPRVPRGAVRTAGLRRQVFGTVVVTRTPSDRHCARVRWYCCRRIS